MITKNKSTRGAQMKILLILPMLCFLILAFADSKTIREPDQALLKNEENVAPVQEKGQSRTAQADQKKQNAEKKKQEKLKKIDMSIKELEAKYNKTDDAEQKKKIKERMVSLLKQRENLEKAKYVKIDVVPDSATDVDPDKAKYVKVDVGHDFYVVKADVSADDDVIQMNGLRALYEKTDDPEKKKLIQQKILELEKKKKIEEKKNMEMALVELEKKYAQTDDPELKKKIKEKIEQLRKNLKK